MTLTRRELFTSLFQTNTGLLPIITAQAQNGGNVLSHLLSRITYGPRPEEVARAREIGYTAFLEEQLQPDDLDDATADAILARKPILKMHRRDMYSMQDYEYRVYKTLIEGMVLRAVHSRRQLLERMVEFWADHFNISSDTDGTPDLLIFQRDVIRKHALGNFHNLLIGTAKSPAMLVYLDNYVNVAAHPNENYARELLELHTLGVDGGYNETDVKEVARAFTGWTTHNGTQSGFWFNEEEHDAGSKTVLGHQFPAGRGIEDGLHVLSILAHHEATARFVSRKLAVRFVRDDPPDSLVEAMTQTWLQSRGEIKPVLRTLFLSDEFKQAAGQKLRRPLDFFIGALRATGTQIRDNWLFEQMVQDLGQPPYGWHPPNGYPDVAAAWMSTNGLLARWNLAMQLTHAAYSDNNDTGWGLYAQFYERIGEPDTVGDLVDAVATQIWGAPLSNSQRRPFVDYVAEGATADGNGANVPVTPHLIGRKLGSLFGLMLASPLYQWR